MWIWSSILALTALNMTVLSLRTNSEYDTSGEQLRFKLAMDSGQIEPYVYRHRFPRKIHQYDTSVTKPPQKAQDRFPRSHASIQTHLKSFDQELESDPSYAKSSQKAKDRFPRSHLIFQPHLKSINQESESDPSYAKSLQKANNRLPRSHAFIQPHLISFGQELESPTEHIANSLGIQSRLNKRRQLRRVLRNDSERQILDMDPLQLKEALILGLRTLAKRQATEYSELRDLFNEDVPAEISDTSLYSDNIQGNNINDISENTQAEQDKQEDLIEFSDNERNDLATNDRHQENIIKDSESILKKRSETTSYMNELYESGIIDSILKKQLEASSYSNDMHENGLMEGSEGFKDELSNPSLYSHGKHEDKLIESSELFGSELGKSSINNKNLYEEDLLSSTENQRGPINIEFQTEPNDKKDDENMVETNENDVVRVYEDKSDFKPLEFQGEIHPKRHANVKSYKQSFGEPSVLEVKSLPEGRNLEISKFLTSGDNSINLIDNLNSINQLEESKITRVSKGNNINDDSIIDTASGKSKSVTMDDSVINDKSENSDDEEALMKIKVDENKSLEISLDEKSQEKGKTTESSSDSSILPNDSDGDSLKDRNYDSKETKETTDKDDETKNKVEKDNKNTNESKQDTKISTESKESSSESTESSEET